MQNKRVPTSAIVDRENDGRRSVISGPESEDVVKIDEGYHAGSVTPIIDSALTSFLFIRRCLTSLAICQVSVYLFFQALLYLIVLVEQSVTCYGKGKYRGVLSEIDCSANSVLSVPKLIDHVLLEAEVTEAERNVDGVRLKMLLSGRTIQDNT